MYLLNKRCLINSQLKVVSYIFTSLYNQPLNHNIKPVNKQFYCVVVFIHILNFLFIYYYLWSGLILWFQSDHLLMSRVIRRGFISSLTSLEQGRIIRLSEGDLSVTEMS